MAAVREALPCRKPALARNLDFIFPSHESYLIFATALHCWSAFKQAISFWKCCVTDNGAYFEMLTIPFQYYISDFAKNVDC
jgi:hypothetical protein